MSTIIVHQNGNKQDIPFSSEINLLEVLRMYNYELSSPCGGHGTCGKCKVEIHMEGKTHEQLACQTIINQDCDVFLHSNWGEITWDERINCNSYELGRLGYGVAVDLGTTTVAITLYNLSNGCCIGTESKWNTQKNYGADVISRISYCIDNTDGLSVLSTLIRNQIISSIESICGQHRILLEEIQEVSLAGNTVMQHIFAKYSPKSIAAAPFIPETLFRDKSPIMIDTIPFYLFPCVAGYVGGDIIAGLFSTGIYNAPGKSLFIDIGTNGEMALGDINGFVSCAVASGPAFEGAGISCGMNATIGAINKVELTPDGLCYSVIGDVEPTGICGSGVLDLIACLLDLGYIDESGCLEENDDNDDIFYLTESVYLNQKDIRQVQLAKAAIASGIRLLLCEEGLNYEDIDSIYLAGGFGNKLRPESAVRIGMLPKQILQRINTCGNSSLAGAEKALLCPSLRNVIYNIAEKCSYIELSSNPDFNTYFIEEMDFPE